ncbi:MAG: tRNA (adenosine(37)-N6)-threonylcarbamoyltransferase complex dimerization subunit type 1 TsaB [Gammaproteobacteria bacterium]|nr:tRNA (adenosine(37)-N6)-threonylcarbamoyltransferase complex dimerization subunit type 1 TsaB [Gammaproteobacteria bacterium]
MTVRLLAIDTTEEACSAALWQDGEVSERFEIAARRHSELVLPMIEDLLGEAGMRLKELDALAFARGPGSFTGVRIAASVIQGLAFAAGLPVIAVSSLQALAQGVNKTHGAGGVLSAFDARMGEVYWGTYRVDADGIMRAVQEERVCAPAVVSVAPGDGPGGLAWHAAGSGWDSYAQALRQAIGFSPVTYEAQRLHAADVATLAAALHAEGHGVEASGALPVYLRDEVAWAKA